MSQGQHLPTSTVLLIEADPSLRRLIVLGLSHSGMHVIEASSVQELPGVDTQKLDLLIVDVDQGVKSDWSLLSMLREQAHMATLPIVALSWESPAEDKVFLLGDGHCVGDGHRKGADEASSSSTPQYVDTARRISIRRSVDDELASSLPLRQPSSRYACTPPRLSSPRGNAFCQPAADLTCLSKPFDARALHSTIAKLLAERAAQKAAQVAIVEAQVLASYERHVAPSIWPVVTAAGLLLVVTGLLLHFLVALVGVVLMLTSLLLWTLGTKPAPSVLPSTVSGMLSAPVN
jgi:CheY-like chemotaxis protein